MGVSPRFSTGVVHAGRVEVASLLGYGSALRPRWAACSSMWRKKITLSW